MQALQKRHIKPGREYDKLFPKSIEQDTVIKSKARLHDTINLIRELVYETKGDTKLLSRLLEGKNLKTTCRNIWNFVYNHIRYRRDKAGVEQVRRPSRTWADRKKGVDCDCYTVFISSILVNLSVPHRIRITKYGGKKHFQHIYPVVPRDNGTKSELDYITIDCVTDYFDYEVPFSDYRDFDMENRSPVGEIHGKPFTTVSGVDSADLLIEDLGIFSLKQPKIPLREITRSGFEPEHKDSTPPVRLTIRAVSTQNEAPKLFVYRIAQASGGETGKKPVADSQILPVDERPARRRTYGLWIKMLIAAGVGYGAFKLLEN